MTGRVLPACLLALTLYGLFANNLLAQPVWTRDGLARLLVFAAAFGGWTLLGLRLIPRWLPHLTAWVALTYTTAIAGPAAVGTLLLFLASSWALGSAITGGVAAMLVGACFYALLLGLTISFPVHYAAVYLAVLAIPLLWRRNLFARLHAPGSVSNKEAAAGCLLLGILILHLLAALQPESGADALSVHLAVPASMATHHQWTIDFRHTTWALMPLTADWTYTAVYLPGGAAAAKLLNFSFLAATVALLYDLLRRHLSSAASLVLCALYASSPILQLVTGSLFVENFWTAMLLAGFASLAHPAACGILLGTAIASKYGAVFYAIPVLMLLARRHQTRRLPLALLLAVCFAAPPYLRAFLESGNPVFPFFNTVFHSPHFQSREAFADTRFNLPLTWRTLYDLTFHTSRYLEGQDGGWGFAYLILVPIALLNWRRNAALAVALPYAILSFLAQSNARYLCPALPLFTLAGWRIPMAAALALIPFQIYFLAASGWQHKGFDRRMEDPAPVQALIEYLNRTHPGEPVAFFETNQIAGLASKAYTVSWHNHAFWRAVLEVDSPRACLNLMSSHGLRLFIAPMDLSRISRPSVRQFLAAYTRPEAEYAGWRVSRLEPDWARQPTAVLEPGSHDDMDPRIEFQGAWDGDRQFAQPANGSVTYCSVPGALFRFRFRGRTIAYVYTKAANRGIAEVRIDGSPRAAIDLYSSETAWQSKTVFGGLDDGEHTFEVRVTGRRNPQATDVYVDLDQVIVESK